MQNPNQRHYVTISNGGLSLTFKIAWGAVVTAVDNSNLANGLNIEDTYGVGRLFQVDQFLHPINPSQKQKIINPTQTGAVTKRYQVRTISMKASPAFFYCYRYMNNLYLLGEPPQTT